MKHVLILFSLVAMVLIGCKDSSNFGIVSPENSQVSNNNSFSFLKLPARLQPRTSLNKKDKMMITPEEGGKIKYKDSYMSVSGLVEIEMELKFEKHSVLEAMIVDVSTISDSLTGQIELEFSPSPVTFLIPAKLNMKVKGLDPSTLPDDASQLKLVYSGQGDQENVFQVMKVKEITMHKEKGEIEVKEGEIPHFSRYAWSR